MSVVNIIGTGLLNQNTLLVPVMPQPKPPRKNSRKDYESSQAPHVMARLELMNVIAKAIADYGWTQKEAARVLGVAQPRVSDLINGRCEKFTVDMLMIWLERLGKTVSMSVNPSRKPVHLTLYVAGKAHAPVVDGLAGLMDNASAAYNLKIIDVLDQPHLAVEANIRSTPCLVREAPAPRVAVIGNLTPSHLRWCLP